MKLVCCELASIVGVVAISQELGCSVARVNRYLRSRGIRPAGNTGFANCNVYNSKLVKQAFNNVNFDNESEV